MLDGVSTPILATQAQQGDIYNKSNHVRLVSSVTGIGNTIALEASSTGWRVQSNTYTPAALTAYTPRVFNNSASCGTPTSLYVSSIAPTSVTINWTAAGVSNYTYYLKTSGSSKYTVYGPYTYKPVTFTGLSSGTTYNFKVAGNCANGTWGISSSITFTTPVPFVPTNTSDTIAVSDGGSITGVSEQQNAICQVSISPNPVKAGQEISLEGVPEKTQISIYSLDGKMMFTEKVSNSSTKFILPTTLPPSIYIVNLKSENGFTENKRLVVTE